MTSESLWNYYSNEVNDDANENNAAGYFIMNNIQTKKSKSCEYKTKLTRKTLTI